MTGGNVISPTSGASCPVKNGANPASPPPLARILSRSPASRVGVRYLTPKDLSRELSSAGIILHEQSIRRRCNLPADDAARIDSNPLFPGRFFIPESELARLLNLNAEASA